MREKKGVPAVIFRETLFLVLIPVAIAGVFALALLVRRLDRRLVGHFGKPKILITFSSLRGRQLRNAFWLALVISLLLLALADPALPYSTKKITHVFNHIVVLDVSRSMGAEDYPGEISRIEMARRCLLRLYEAYPRGTVGVVLFTDKVVSFEATTDREVARFLIRYATDLDKVRGEGSDLALALEEALQVIEDASPSQEIKTIIVLTDGGESDSVALWGINRLLSNANTRVIAAGLGGDELVPIPNRDPKTSEIVSYHFSNDRQALTSLNERPLTAISGRGEYVRIREEKDLVNRIRTGRYATDTIFSESDEETSLVQFPLGALLVVLVAWLVDKRFLQG